MTINEYLKSTISVTEIGKSPDHKTIYFQNRRPRVYCKDGFNVSIQASDCMCCEPQIIQVDPEKYINYEEIDAGFPSEPVPEWEEYCVDPDDELNVTFGYLPVELADQVLEKHGGIDFEKTIEMDTKKDKGWP